MAKENTGKIRIGIGGWAYEPWDKSFYPEKLSKKRQLEYASSKLTSIEINSTYYGPQKPATFAKWHDETPEGFVFSLKAPRFSTNRRVLAEAGPLDVLFNCAGFVHQNTIETCTDDEWNFGFALNVRSMWQTIRAALPGMLGKGGGVIVNMSSACSSVKRRLITFAGTPPTMV